MTSATPLTDQLAELQARAHDHDRVPGSIERERQAKKGAVELASADLARFHSTHDGTDSPERRRFAKALEEAKKAAESDWKERVIGAKQAAGLASREVDRFVQENLSGLITEAMEMADADRDAFVEAAKAFEAAYLRYNRTDGRWFPLVQHMDGGAGQNRTPSIVHVESAVNAVRRYVHDEIPSQIPMTLLSAEERAA